MNAGARKLSCRTSTTWRIGRPSSLGGSNAKKAAKSSGSNFLVGAICQSTGPSFDFNSNTPLAKKRSIDGPASASTRRLVANCGPLSENTKSIERSEEHTSELQSHSDL